MIPRARTALLLLCLAALACADGNADATRGDTAGPFVSGPPGTGTSAGPVADIVAVAPRTRLAVGDTVRLAATPRDSMERAVRGRTLAWRSDHPAILVVDGSGLARAVAPGTAVVTVETSGVHYELALTVPRAESPVVVRPGDELQAAVDRSPTGTTFRLTAGVYRRQSVTPKDGMAFLGDSGAVLDGERVTDYAFRSDGGQSLPRNVLLRGLEVRHYVPELQQGAVRADAGMGGWTIEACDVHDNATGGIRLGDRTRVLRSRVHHNGRTGVLGGGDDVRVEDSEIAYNNAAHYDMYEEAGGGKFTRTRDLVVRRNFVHHNYGFGLWTDIDNVRTLYERNRVEDNAEAGIYHEISYAAVIRDNVTRRNGTHPDPPDWVTGAGILVSSSRDVDVHGNVVEDNHNGITALHRDDRGTGPLGRHGVANLRVHDNTIVMRRGVTGVFVGGWRRLIDRATYEHAGNSFQRNTYRLTGPGDRWFEWRDGRRTAAEWRAFGQDTAGTFGR